MHIKDWAAGDRPREKMLQKGSAAVSDAELLAILIGSGTSSVSALEVAKKILHMCGNDLHRLARLSAFDLKKIKGIGDVRAVTIMASFELGRRRREIQEEEHLKIRGSSDAYRQIASDLMDLPHEEFWVLMLNRANRVIRKKRVSEGGVSGTVADPKIIFKAALEELASGIIVAHNHPSGNLTASQSDIELTTKLRDAGRFLEVQLLDHLIIAGQKYYSFADEGLM